MDPSAYDNAMKIEAALAAWSAQVTQAHLALAHQVDLIRSETDAESPADEAAEQALDDVKKELDTLTRDVRGPDAAAAMARLQLAVCLGICVGLSGLAVGLGARFPVFGQRNPARIASGFGGTFNLIASMLFVSAEMAGLAFTTLVRFGAHLPAAEEIRVGWWLVPVLVLLGFIVAAVSLWIGMRHFERLEY